MRILIKCTLLMLLFSSCGKKEFIQEHYENGNLREEFFIRNNHRTGKYCSYYENGIQKSLGQYRNNKMVGEWKYYYSDGSLLSEQCFRNGVLVAINAWNRNSELIVVNGTGTFYLYYPNGNTLSKVTYFNNRKHGIWKAWHENGKLSSKIEYDNDKPVGKWEFYDKDGNLLRKETK